MAASKQSAAVTLFYGNQSYSVEEAARALVDRILGDGPRDFSLHRFDAEELLKPTAGEAGEALDAFQLACESPPFLCETYVVRVDHVEAVKAGDRALQNVQRQLGELRVHACRFEDAECWALPDDLLPDEQHGPVTPVGRWVTEVEGRSGAPPVLHLADLPPEEAPRFVRTQRGERQLIELKAFLRHALRTRFEFADEAGGVDAGAATTNAARLYRLLERTIESTPPGLHLVLTARAGREGDLARGLLTAVKKHGRVEKFVTYDDYNPADWVQREARSRGLNLQRTQAELLIHLVGNNLGRLASELDKLALAFPQGSAPDEEALLTAVHGGQGTSVFAITERLGGKELAGALAVLEHFLGNSPGEHPVLIGILARFFRQLLHVHSLEAAGVSAAEQATHLKLHPFIARKVAAQARRFTPAELEGALRALAALDVAAKRHGHLVLPLFREYVQAVCQGGFRGGTASPRSRLADLG